MNKEIIIMTENAECDTEASMNMWNARAWNCKVRGVEEDDWVRSWLLA